VGALGPGATCRQSGHDQLPVARVFHSSVDTPSVVRLYQRRRRHLAVRGESEDIGQELTDRVLTCPIAVRGGADCFGGAQPVCQVDAGALHEP
jgi:hypothetical protein